MSWDRDRTSSTSSASSPSSSSLPAQSRVRSSGLPSLSSIDQRDASSPSGERLRLPPLSSLISGSSSQYPSGASLAPPSKDVPSGVASSSTPRQEWSPIGYNHQGSRFADLNHSPEQQHASSPQRSDDPHRPFHHHQHHRIHQDHAGMTDGQQQQSHQHYVASQPSYPPIQGSRRSNSMSSSSAHSVSLPPLTSLTIQTSSRSPSLASASLTDREMAAPRHTPGIYSLHRSPLPPSSPSSKHSIGPSRRRYTGGSSSHTPYERRSPPTDAEYFDQVWDIYSYACRVNDEASDSIRQSYPTIAHLDLKSLLYHLHRELDELDQRNPRLSMQLAQDAGLTGPIKPSHMSPASSPLSASVPHHQHGWMNALRGANEASLAAPRDAGGGNTSSYFDRGHMYRRDSRGESSSSSTTSPPLARVISSHPSYHHHSLPSLSPGGLKHASLHSAAGGVNSVYAPMTPTSAAAAAAAAAVAASALPPKRVRKRKDEAEQSCLSCSATETPEWRKGPTGPRTLCNACGLLFAKQCRKKELDAQARGERPKGSRPIAPEIMSPEEKERSLAELKVAVNARAANVSPPI